MKRYLLLIVVLVAVGMAKAQALAGSGSLTWPTVGNWTLTFVSASKSGSTVAAVFNTSSTAGGGWMEFNYQFKLNGSVVSSGFGVNQWANANQTGWQWAVNAPASWDALRIYPRQGGQTGEISISATPPAPSSYGLTVQLPANLTPRSKLYFFLQSGAQVGSAVQHSGQSARSVYVGGLSSNTPIQVVEVTGGTVGMDSNGNFLLEAGTQYIPAGAQVTPTGETTSGSGATATAAVTANNSQVFPTTSPVTVPAAPTVTSTPTTPTSTTAPSVPSATTAPTLGTLVTANSGDAGADQVTQAVNKNTEHVVSSATATVAAVDKVAGIVQASGAVTTTAVDKVAAAVWDGAKRNIEATDKVASAVWEQSKANVEGLNKISVGLDAVRAKVEQGNATLTNISTSTGATASKLDATNTKLDTIATKLEEQKTNSASEKTAAETAASQVKATADAQAVVSRGQIETAVGGRQLRNYGDSATSSGSLLTIEWPGVATIDLDPAHDEKVSTLAGWMKASIAFLILALFDWWLWRWFKEIYMALSVTQPAKGNPVVAGTGAQATSLVVAMAITGVLVSLPTAFWAMADAGLTVTLVQNPVEAAASGGGSLGTGLYLFNFFFPTVTLLAALSSVALVLKGGLVLLAGMQTLIRFLIA